MMLCAGAAPVLTILSTACLETVVIALFSALAPWG
jgi:hypothetical protein